MNKETITAYENGIHVQLNSNHSVPKKCDVFFNEKMKLTREFCLAALHVFSSEVSSSKVSIRCLDAFGATGITGLQWKRHLKNAVDVTINDWNIEVCRDIRATITRNGMRASSSSSEPLQTLNSIGKEQNVLNLGHEDSGGKHRIDEHFTSTVTDNIHSAVVKNEIHPSDKMTDDDDECLNIEISCEDARVLMHQRQYHFIQLDPFGCTVPFLEATFHNVCNGGVVVVTATDVASLYGKCSRTLLRNYGARYGAATVDYYKELAVRVLLAAVARAAVHCKKGIRVLYCLTAEHFVQVCVRVCRGATLADQCIEQIHEMLHCRVCQETAVIPHDFIDDFYGLLPCQCRRNDGTRSAAVIGPIWCGDIFEAAFIRDMSQSAKELSLSSRSQKLLSVMLQEAEYEKLTSDNTSSLLHLRLEEKKNENLNHCIDDVLKTTPLVDGDSDQIVCTDRATLQNSRRIVNGTFASDSDRLNECNVISARSSENVCSSDGLPNYPISECVDSLLLNNETDPKLASFILSTKVTKDVVLRDGITKTVNELKMSFDSSKNIGRMFYVCLYRRHVAGVEFPRLPVLIRLLQNEGYCASATHFDSQALRTNASQQKIIDLMRIRRV